MPSLTPEKQLSIISKAWGRQKGYAFFPWISGTSDNRDERIQSYHEGPAFRWPADRDKILEHFQSHTSDDLYWCPSLFEHRRRTTELAMDEHALWADLDEVDPRDLKEYPPTIAWETSPGRYQALWLITGGDIQGASWQGGENHRLTYYIGADPSGWDTTQLLRIPGWKNHKYEWKQENAGEPVEGTLLWENGRRYLPDEFEDLPEVQTLSEVQTILEDEIESIDRHQVYGRVRLKIPHKAREMMSAREVSGDRSSQLWWLMRCFADAGCTATEIVAVLRDTVWNKFAGRQDELKRLTIEASKAVTTRDPVKAEGLEEEREHRDKPQRLAALLKGVKPPKWLVTELWAEGACGFIAGQPKAFKSWMGLDLALSVSTGLPFLDHFSIRNPGPVLYIQEEDSLPMVKSRFDKIWPGKQIDKVKMEDGQLVWDPGEETEGDPPLLAHIGNGFTISDAGWQSWLDEVLTDGVEDQPFRMCVLDPLMMIAGEVEENRAQEMTEKIFKPLKQLARKHKTAMAVVHHMKKGDPSKPTRGGQLMLGSVANHAWAEDSMYLRVARGGDIVVERESKHTTGGSFKVTRLRNKQWTPTVVDDKLDEWAGDSGASEKSSGSAGSNGNGRRGRSGQRGLPKVIAAMNELGVGAHATRTVAEQMGDITTGGAYKQLMRAEEQGQVKKVGSKWELARTNS